MTPRNSRDVWNRYWQGTMSEDNAYVMKLVERTALWRWIERAVLAQHGSFQGLDVLEIGGGRGAIAALMAVRGANVTILDYADEGIRRAEVLFQNSDLSARFVLMDALDLDPDLEGAFDVAMSFGLLEHYRGVERLDLFKSHFDLIRSKGVTLIAVPYKFNVAYRMYKALLESLGRFLVEEYPFSKREMTSLCNSLSVQRYELQVLEKQQLLSFFGVLRYLDRRNIIGRVLKTVNHGYVDPSRAGADCRYVHHVRHLLVLCAQKWGNVAVG